MHQRITQLINLKKFSIKYIIENSGSKKTTIANVKKGEILPNTKFIIWLFKEFPNLNPQWLFFDEGEMWLEEENANAQNNQVELLKRVGGLEKEVSNLKGMKKQIKEIAADFKELNLESLKAMVEEMIKNEKEK